MRIRKLVVSIAALGLLVLASVAVALYQGSTGTEPLDREHASIVFVCRNGVAMSVWSALTFNQLAAERGLVVRAAARAALPTFTDVPLRMRLALAIDGHRAGNYRPQVISAEDIGRAQRVILIDTELPTSASAAGTTIERWGGFPAMRDEYFASRAALKTRVEELVARLAATDRSS